MNRHIIVMLLAVITTGLVTITKTTAFSIHVNNGGAILESKSRGSIRYSNTIALRNVQNQVTRRYDNKSSLQHRNSGSKVLTSTRNNEDESSSKNNKKLQLQKDEVVLGASVALHRISWLSWWTQMILSTVSSVTLVFTKSVAASSSSKTSGLYLAGSGIVLSFLSIFWTWGAGARLSKRLRRRSSITRTNAASMIRKTLTIGVVLNLLGMFITIIGAEQIVGVLAAKVLTSSAQGFSLSTVSTQLLQPIDILVVQANTNTLLSHFCSLFLLLSLVKWVDRLDPPSSNDQKRIVIPSSSS